MRILAEFPFTLGGVRKSGRKEVVTDGIIPEKGAAERTPSLSANVDGNQATGSQAPGVTAIQTSQ